MTYREINGANLWYEDRGEGRPILFLHGWATSNRVWDAQVADLVTDHRVITLDWRGCGRSDQPADGNTVTGNTNDVLTLVRELELDQPVLVGSSIGGAFATEAAVREPDLISGIVLVNAPGYWPVVSMVEQIAELTEALRANRAATIAGMVPTWFAEGTDQVLIDLTTRRALEAGVFIDELFTDCLNYDPRPGLAALRTKAAFVHGLLDAQIPAEVSQTCADLVPNGKFVPIEGSGHFPHMELPSVFNAALRAVID